MIYFLALGTAFAGLNSIFESSSKEESLSSEDVTHRGSDYFSKKDAKVVGLALGMFLLFGIPAFLILKQQTNLYFCKQRFIAISTALSSYESQNDNRLPALFLDSGNGIPSVDSKGRPLTWATTLVNLAGVDHYNPNTSFMCTNAHKRQASITEGPKGENLYMTDGMFVGVALQQVSDFSYPGNVIAIGETSNGGTFGSFDPYPIYPNGPNSKANDAYEIGFDTPTGYPTTNHFPDTSVTRLWKLHC